ncbi:MAG TPA: hypothetical protein VIU62_23615 [Chloroflexota bacterium]|jgi:hypothetical protein
MANLTIGTNPQSNNDINLAVGGTCRQFLLFKAQVARLQATLAGLDLKIAPFTFASGDEATLKSAVNGLNTALVAIDVTFINECAGSLS